MRQRVAYSLLQAWYCILEGGIFVLLNLQFFLGKSETSPRAWLIPLMLIQIAGLGVGNFGLSKLMALGPRVVLAHTLLMFAITLASVPFRESGILGAIVPLALHGVLAWGAWRALRIPPDAA
jgi:hypothetical protein